MTKKPDNAQKSAYSPATCQVGAVLPVDSRGQIVIPKEVRKRANIRDNDKLALVSWMNKNEICCLALIRADTLSSEVSGLMHTLLADND
jgi:AbrB family looped-hinge helix DNA binding protein